MNRWAWVGLLAACGLACTGDSGGSGRCRFLSISSSGGLCSLTLNCGAGFVGLSCDDNDCACVADGRGGMRFDIAGACGMEPEALTSVYEARCPPPVVDAGVVADAGPHDSGPPDVPPVVTPCVSSGAVDLLFVIDNSNSMAANQATLTRSISGLFNGLVNPISNGAGVTLHPPVTSLHVGVISTDLGTPGSTVPSCANSDVGDDGMLNPIRNGRSMPAHQPWTTSPAGTRPSRCRMDPAQYPSFLTFEASSGNTMGLRDDFICNAYLSIGGCGLEQQLESAYRALVTHNPRAVAGNTEVNAGFVRDDAVLAIVMFTDEEDMSVRDCRYAESGVPCTDGTGAFDNTSTAWASSDLNLRGYMYTPGSAQDPTWPIDRYMDPARPMRGFTSVKPGRPGNVVFAALAGVPIQFPQTGSGDVDWQALLGNNPDGSDGYTAMSPEGPVSMQQRNMDPSCSTRVLPACRREGSTYNPTRPPCSTDQQYFALPSRRVAEVARRFAATYQTGTVSSICRFDYGQALDGVERLIGSRLCAR